jgi:hypothetical protein
MSKNSTSMKINTTYDNVQMESLQNLPNIRFTTILNKNLVLSKRISKNPLQEQISQSLPKLRLKVKKSSKTIDHHSYIDIPISISHPIGAPGK